MKVMLTGSFANGVPDYYDVSAFDIVEENFFIELSGCVVQRSLLTITKPQQVLEWEAITQCRIEKAHVTRVLVESGEVVPFVCTTKYILRRINE